MKTLRVLIVLFIIAVIIFSVAAWLIFRTPGLSDHTIVKVDLNGDVPEFRADSGISSLFEGEPLTVSSIYRALTYAATDSRVDGVVFRVTGCRMGFARLQEVRDLIHALNRAGKFTLAYADSYGEFSPGNGQYYLASSCDSVVLNPLGDVNLIGLDINVPFLRGTLDKLKIEPDFDHVREYKTAMNTFTEKSFTKAHREMMESLGNDIFDQMLEGIATDRKIEQGHLRALVDDGPFSAEEAIKNKLVDRTAFWDEVVTDVEKKVGDEHHWASLRSYAKHVEDSGTKIAVIYGMGPIFVGKSASSPFSSEPTMGSETVAKIFKKVREERSIKGVIFRVDSPGGSAVASEIIRRALVLTKEKKPVVVSMSDVAGSGGYWVSMSADRIISQPGALTGSIGVVVGKFNMRKFWGDLIGITYDEVQIGKNADFYSDLKTFSPEQKEIRTRFMENVYSLFVKNVAKSRHLSEKRVNEIGRGRVWTGKQALDLKLVDDLGGMNEAVKEVKRLAKIPEDAGVDLVTYPRKKSIFDLLVQKKSDVRVWMDRVKTGTLVLGPVWCPITFEVQ